MYRPYGSWGNKDWTFAEEEEPDQRRSLTQNDDEAIAQAEVARGSFGAELLVIEGLRIVKYLPSNGGSPPQAAE